MPKNRSGPSNPRRKTGVVRGRRALNSFHIEDDEVPSRTEDAEENPEVSDEGGVKSEDDEDIDSDEAFDEDDEKRYSTFKFSGSSSKSLKAKQRKSRQAESSKAVVDEDEEEESDDEGDEETYMDLSEMLSNGQSKSGNGFVFKRTMLTSVLLPTIPTAKVKKNPIVLSQSQNSRNLKSSRTKMTTN
jgi:U3 small nucleolar RNA-associated protein 14